SPVEKIAILWVQRVSPSLSALIATLGFGGLLGVPLALWSITEITTDLLPAQTEVIETQFLRQIQQLSHPLLDQVMVAVTMLGYGEVVIPVFLITLSLLYWRRNYWQVLMSVIAFGGAVIINHELTLLFERSRPDLQPPFLIESEYTSLGENFLQGTVLYGIIAYLLTIRHPRLAWWLYGGAFFLIGGIGFSRMYLGLQWPLDVLAGWSGGFLWLTICIILLRLQDIRNSVKQQQKKMSIKS
ncbi:MAG: phosphatase PAP2 family protein, partial [Prochloraceae cyanobacterium]